MLPRALLCVSSPAATISIKWLSCAFMTSSAVFPRNGVSHGPPICLHVIVFTFTTSFHCRVQQLARAPAPRAGRCRRLRANCAPSRRRRIPEGSWWSGQCVSWRLIGSPGGAQGDHPFPIHKIRPQHGRCSSRTWRSANRSGTSHGHGRSGDTPVRRGGRVRSVHGEPQLSPYGPP